VEGASRFVGLYRRSPGTRRRRPSARANAPSDGGVLYDIGAGALPMKTAVEEAGLDSIFSRSRLALPNGTSTHPLKASVAPTGYC
jgi:hypothetical protein